jgi:hypothetical protein
MDALLYYAEQEAAYKVQNPLTRKDDPAILQHLKGQYENILSAFRKTRGLSREERKTRAYLRHEVRRLRAKLQPTIFRSIVYARPVNWLLNTLLRRRANYRRHAQTVSAVGKSTLIEYNVAEIHQQMAKVGFTGQIESALKRLMNHNLPAFSVRHVQPDVPHTDFLLHFEKVPGRDVYHFKSFDALALPNIQSVLANNPAAPTMNFFLNQGISFSANEAGNLANGRPVQKEGHGQTVWYMQDHSGTPSLQQRPFDVEQALTELKLKGPGDPSERAKLVSTLRAGGVGNVTFKHKDGQLENYRVKVGFNADRLIFMDADNKLVDPKMIGLAREKAIGLTQELHKAETQKTRLSARPARIH